MVYMRYKSIKDMFLGNSLPETVAFNGEDMTYKRGTAKVSRYSTGWLYVDNDNLKILTSTERVSDTAVIRHIFVNDKDFVCSYMDRQLRVLGETISMQFISSDNLRLCCVEKLGNYYGFGFETSMYGFKLGIIATKDLKIKVIYMDKWYLYDCHIKELIHEPEEIYLSTDIHYVLPATNYRDFLKNITNYDKVYIQNPYTLVVDDYDYSEIKDTVFNGHSLARTKTMMSGYLCGGKLYFYYMDTNKLVLTQGHDSLVIKRTDTIYGVSKFFVNSEKVFEVSGYAWNYRLDGVLRLEDLYAVLITANDDQPFVLFLDIGTMRLKYFLCSFDITLSDKYRGMYNKSRIILG